MELLAVAFVAGVLTALAPCILPLLPIIVGGSVQQSKHWSRPFIITGSLALSIIAFTLLLKATSMLLGVPFFVWELISGGIIIALGATMVWPTLWEPLGARLNTKTGALLGKAGKRQGVIGDILTGAALGPVFSSCSPTYAFIVASVLPVSLGMGIGYLIAYALGLAIILLLVALIGQQLVSRLGWASNPNGWFKRAMGVIFIVVGFFVATGFDHQLQGFLVELGWYDGLAEFERSILSR